MRNRRWLAVIIPIFLLIQLPVQAVTAAPGVSAQAYILYDAESDVVLAASNAEARLPCASTTKIMTALVVLETLPLDTCVTITAEQVRVEGSRMYLRDGETVTVSDLLYGLLLASGNDAALALAEAAAGSTEQFAAQMNRKAAELGLKHTHFTNPSGLHEPEHYTTARDLAVLMAAAMQNPVFAAITGTREAVLTGRTVVNHNKLLHQVPGVDGGKTGYTKAAGRCLVSTARRCNRRLIAVTLNAPDDWNDHDRLYAYGFAQYQPTLLSEGGISCDTRLTLVGGREPSVALTADRVEIWLTREEQLLLTKTILLPHFEYAPLRRNCAVGQIQWQINGRTVASAELRTAETVPGDFPVVDLKQY